MLKKLKSVFKTDLTPIELLVRGSFFLITKKLNTMEGKIMAMFDELEKQVMAMKSAAEGAEKVILTLADKVASCGTDEAMLNKLVFDLKKSAEKLGEAVAANTPAEEPPVTDIPPAEPNP